MAEKIQTISPTGKLNWDDALEVMPSGDCRERWNVEMSEVGKYGKLSNIKGTRKWDVLAGTDIVIGGCWDGKREEFLLICVNSSTYNKGKIIAVKEQATTPFYTYRTVFEYATLFEDFASLSQAQTTYVDAKVLGDILILTDGINEPKAIDIVKAEATYAYVPVHFTKVIVDQVTYGANSIVYAVGNSSWDSQFTTNDIIYVSSGTRYEYGGVVKVTSTQPSSNLQYMYVICDIGRSITDANEIVSTYAYMYEDGDAFNPIGDDNISLIIPTPRYAPEVSCTYDVSVADSSIGVGDAVFQFATSYVYYNDSVSLLSPISKESLDNESPLEDQNGTTINTIKLTITIDRANIKKLRIYARKISDAVSNFYLIEELDRLEQYGNIIYYNFYGNLSSIATGNVDAVTIQDAVPYASEAVCIIKDNIVVLAGNTEGYEIVTNSLTATYSSDSTVGAYTKVADVTKVSDSAGSQKVFGDYNSQISNLTLTGLAFSNTDQGYLFWEIVVGATYTNFNLYKVWNETGTTRVANSVWRTDTGSATHSITAIDSSGVTGSIVLVKPSTGWADASGIVRTTLGNYSKFSLPNVTSNYSYGITLYGVPGTKDTIYVPMNSSTQSELTAFIISEINAHSYSGMAALDGTSLKVSLPTEGVSAKITVATYYKAAPYAKGGFIDDTTHYLIQNYYDKYGRLKYISDIKKISIPYICNTTGTRSLYSDKTIALSVTIAEEFTADVDTYSFAVARINKRWDQYLVGYTDVWDATLANTDLGYEADVTKTGLYAIAIDTYSIQKGMGAYEFVEGDSIRVVAYTIFGATYYTEVKYKDIIKSSTVADDGSTIIFVESADMLTFLSNIVNTGMNTRNYYVFEVYRDYSEEDADGTSFFECTTRYKTTASDTGKNIKIYNGEAFIIDTTDHYVKSIRSPKHSISSTIYTRQWGKIIGRDEDSTIKYRNSIRNGGKAFQNTSINNLFRFSYSDVEYLNDNHGTIKGLESVGNTIRVYQERKTTSIYVGGTEMANVDGTTQIIRSDKVLGTLRPNDDNYGLQIKTAKVNTGDAIYVYDIVNGVVLRDNNGVMPITGRVSTSEYSNDFKMERFFKTNSKYVATKANYAVSLGYNKDNKTLFVTNPSDSSYVTISFSEEHGFWNQFISMTPKLYIHGGLFTITIDNELGKVYRLYDDDTGSKRCYLENTQRDFKFQVVLNDNGKMQKTVEAVSMTSTQPLLCNITIAASPSYAAGMKSRIRKNRWRLEENIYRADVLRNMLPNETAHELYNGVIMRGSAATLEFIEDDSDEAIDVLAVDVAYSDSSQ